jgi:hypothetical protein
MEECVMRSIAWKTVLLMLASTTCYAGAYTAWAAPTQIDVVTNQGIMVYGAFGNPAGCTVSNQFFVYFSNTQYKEMYTQILAALTTGKQISVYVTECDPVSWYSAASTTYGALTDNSAIQIKN